MMLFINIKELDAEEAGNCSKILHDTINAVPSIKKENDKLSVYVENEIELEEGFSIPDFVRELYGQLGRSFSFRYVK